jgi:hypothetical protein
VGLALEKRWDRNFRVHDIPGTKRSIRKHGFRNPAIFDDVLNDGEGGISAGNGRTQALVEMRDAAEDLPQYLREAEGEWYFPMIFGVASATLAILLVVVMALFPEVVVVLSASAVIVGFNALFGVGIALPIVQSMIRHVEAGGCGDEVQAQYAEAIAQGNALLEASSLEVQQWWQEWFAADPVLDASEAV